MSHLNQVLAFVLPTTVSRASTALATPRLADQADLALDTKESARHALTNPPWSAIKPFFGSVFG